MPIIKKCPLCKEDIRAYYLNASVWQCKTCGILFRNPMPEQEEIINHYNISWINPSENTDSTGGTNPRIAAVYAKKLTHSINPKELSGLKILDLGAGNGEMMSALSELGAEVYGIEPYGYAVLRDKGFNIYHRIEEIPGDLQFDGIVMTDVVEHLTNPGDTLKKLYALLIEGGFLYISTMNTRGLNARIFKSFWREIKKKSHLYFFTSKTLRKSLLSSGFSGCRRLMWLVPYKNNPVGNCIQFILQLLFLDGELRYITYRDD